MIIWTPTVSSVLYACVLYFCICTCSAQLSMFNMEGALEIHSLLLLLFGLVGPVSVFCNKFDLQLLSHRGSTYDCGAGLSLRYTCLLLGC